MCRQERKMELLPVVEEEAGARKVLAKRGVSLTASLVERNLWYVLATMISSLAQAVRTSSTETEGVTMSTIAPSALLLMDPSLVTRGDSAQALIILLL
jgi:hypothetical protein